MNLHQLADRIPWRPDLQTWVGEDEVNDAADLPDGYEAVSIIVYTDMADPELSDGEFLAAAATYSLMTRVLESFALDFPRGEDYYRARARLDGRVMASQSAFNRFRRRDRGHLD